MAITIVLTTLLNVFAFAPDLCSDAYLNAAGEPYTDSTGMTLSRFCQWAGPDVPVWDNTVCCTFDADGAQCSVPTATGACAVGEPRYCEYGQQLWGEVVCYQSFPSMCEAGYCISEPTEPPPGPLASELGCCSAGGACQVILSSQLWECKEGGGEWLACNDGTVYIDGTMDCWD